MQRNRLISHFVSVSLILQTFAGVSLAAVDPQQGEPDQAPLASQLAAQHKAVRNIASFASAIQEELERSAFDLDALLDDLNYESEEIVAFAKEQIAFEQYPGVLRGPKGVLFSRAGNSIDQALFLAKLLRDAGYDARILGAELPREQALQVLLAMKQPISPPPPIGDPNELLKVLRKFGLVDPLVSDRAKLAFSKHIKSIPRAKDYPTYDKVQETTSFIATQLRSSGVKFENRDVDEELLQEARQYFWVQHKESVSKGWTDVHPAFAAQAPFSTPEPREFFASQVPERLQHRIRFQAFIERKVGSKLEVLPITSTWEQPVANLVGVPLTFANFSDSMLSASQSELDIDTAMQTARSFAPTFGSGLAPGAKFFDLHGNIIDPMAASNPAAGIFSEVNSAFSEAIGAISEEGAVPTLTAQWMDFVIVGPGGVEKAYRRTTFDRIGPAARASNSFSQNLPPTTLQDARPLLQRHTFVTGVGPIPRGFAINNAADGLKQWMPGIERVLTINPENDKAPGGPLPEVPSDWGGMWALLSLLERAGAIESSHRSYRSAPLLFIHSEGLGHNTNHLERIDIVSNPRRVVDVSGSTPRFDQPRMIEAGVWETTVEGAFLNDPVPYSTFSTFDLAKQNGLEPVLLRSEATLGEISAPRDTHAAIATDMDRGYLVIVPGEKLTSSTLGWWRVDPGTGETLGQILDGRGASATEYIIVTSISVAFFGYGAAQCASAQNARNASRPYTGYFWDNQGVCCMAGTGGLTGLSGLLGVAYLSAYSTIGTAVALELAIDVPAAFVPMDEICGSFF